MQELPIFLMNVHPKTTTLKILYTMCKRNNNQYLGIVIRRIIIVAAVCFGTAILTIQPVSAKSSKPNIIFIMCDDMGYGQLGSYG
jgi:hypothetical protein